MASDGRSARARSFGAVAEDYDRFRPPPPGEAVEWLLPLGCDIAVDIGAGTGALTRELVGRARRVIAVEPDPRMRAVLSARASRATVISGRAEEVPLRDRSVDAVIGSSMWHWVDEPRAAAEAARVLRAGGVLGLLWSGPDRSRGWLSDVLAAPRRGGANRRDEGRPGRARHEVHLPADAPFTVLETRTLCWSRGVTAEQLVGLAGTYSGFIVLPERDRVRLRDGLAEVVASHPAVAGRSEIELPMRCVCWRAVRD
jgi:SAM-dependent methyltransferase